jgi:GT2 family glycosyltransferase
VTDLSIVLLNWNGRALVLDCLASIDAALGAHSGAGRIETETIVVDNGSQDGSVAAIRAGFPWAEIVALPRNVGFAAGNNAGLARARGRHICLLNNDTLVQPGSFELCVDFLDAHPDVGAVGPALVHPDGRSQNSIHNFPSVLLEVIPRGVLETLLPRRYPSKRFPHRAPLDVEAVLGACVFIRREALEQAGGMPEDYFFFLEETDWFFQLRRAGWRVVHHPGAKLVHIHGASTKKRVPLPTRIEYHRSLYHFFHKNRGSLQAGLVVGIRVAKLLLGTVVVLPLLPFWRRERERWVQRLGLLRWHAAGCPPSWGLAGVGPSQETA